LVSAEDGKRALHVAQMIQESLVEKLSSYQAIKI